jgi:hypothetical protein
LSSYHRWSEAKLYFHSLPFYKGLDRIGTEHTYIHIELLPPETLNAAGKERAPRQKVFQGPYGDNYGRFQLEPSLQVKATITPLIEEGYDAVKNKHMHACMNDTTHELQILKDRERELVQSYTLQRYLEICSEK